MNPKADFPILSRQINDQPLVYLDNAATTQKPQVVIDALTEFYKNHNANVHRGNHTLSDEATTMYEETRQTVAKFINANVDEVIFTKNATESINLVAYSWGRQSLHEGDTVILSELEHHSNLIPWYVLAKEKNLKLEFIKIDDRGHLNLNHYQNLLDTCKNIKLVAVTAVSNVLGSVVPITQVTQMAKIKNASIKVLIDGSQWVPSLKTDIRRFDCDFFVFSAHKMLGPTGVGILWGRKEILDEMSPFLTGGSMIDEVGRLEATYAKTPQKFEAGTPNIADVVAFKSAVDYLNKFGLKNVEKIETELLKYATTELQRIDGVTVYGGEDLTQKLGIVSFNIKDVHPHDVSTILDSVGVAVRSGQHCAEPLMKCLGVSATVRVSFYLYNDKRDVDRLVAGVKKVKEIFSDGIKK